MAPTVRRRISREDSHAEGGSNSKRACKGSSSSSRGAGAGAGPLPPSPCRLSPDSGAQSLFATRIAEAAGSLPSDIILIAADGSRHEAHRLVLSARSPFFLKMLTSGMREQHSGEVSLPDVDAERLRAVLDWMYGREALVDVTSPTAAIGLLEIAERWEVTELCEQLSTCEACVLEESTVMQIWEAAQRMHLARLEARCRDYVMELLGTFMQGGGLGGDAEVAVLLPAPLRALAPKQMQALLESEDLPVPSEEQALDLALAYIKEHQTTLTCEEIELVLSSIRWRLVPGLVIAERAMGAQILKQAGGGTIPPRLLTALADGMQFQFLGGKAWTTQEQTVANRLRVYHRIPVCGYAGLAEGMTVRVIGDVDELRHLCKRCAPGARLKVEWVSDMKSLAGATCRITELRDEICGAQLEDPVDKVERYLPFDALLLA